MHNFILTTIARYIKDIKSTDLLLLHNLTKIFFFTVFTTDIIGVVGFPVEFPCDVQPAVEGDQLLLILWFKEGYPSPIYS